MAVITTLTASTATPGIQANAPHTGVQDVNGSVVAPASITDSTIVLLAPLPAHCVVTDYRFKGVVAGSAEANIWKFGVVKLGGGAIGGTGDDTSFGTLTVTTTGTGYRSMESAQAFPVRISLSDTFDSGSSRLYLAATQISGSHSVSQSIYFQVSYRLN